MSDEIWVVECRIGNAWDHEISRSLHDDADEYVDDLAADGFPRGDIRVRRFVAADALDAVTKERDALRDALSVALRHVPVGSKP